MHKYVYLFSEGNAEMRNLLGGKGANLAEMTNIGLPVPQGFTVTTEACTQYYEDGREINEEIQSQINEHIIKMEEITGKKFGDKEVEENCKKVASKHKKEFNLMLSSINDVKDFVNIVCRYDFDVDLTSGRYVVDAKSIMGIFSLNLSKPIKVEVHSDDCDKFLSC